MNNLMNTHKKQIIQLAILAIIASLFAFTRGKMSFLSAILGGACWVLPNLHFRLRMQKIMNSFDIRKMLKLFLVNQALKLVSSFALIILFLSLITVDKRSFLVSYVVMILTSFPMLMSKMTSSKQRVFNERIR